MDFVPAIKSGFQNYVNFSGRSCRSAFWFWVLFTFIVSIVANIVDGALIGMPILGLIWSLAIILPSIAVGVRRLHDIDKSGWWYLINLVPLIGWIVFIVWACTKGTDGANRFGSDPLAGQAAAPAAPTPTP